MGVFVRVCGRASVRRHTKRMETTTYIPVSEYLATSYQPDCDYVDGEVRERNLGEQPHGLVQGAIASIFRQRRKEWGLRSIPEQRVQVGPTRFRIADVCVVSFERSDLPHPAHTTLPLRGSPLARRSFPTGSGTRAGVLGHGRAAGLDYRPAFPRGLDRK